MRRITASETSPSPSIKKGAISQPGEAGAPAKIPVAKGEIMPHLRPATRDSP
jgi:hypothetical protein